MAESRVLLQVLPSSVLRNGEPPGVGLGVRLHCLLRVLLRMLLLRPGLAHSHANPLLLRMLLLLLLLLLLLRLGPSQLGANPLWCGL